MKRDKLPLSIRILFICVLGGLIGCSEEWKLAQSHKRLDKVLENNPEIVAEHCADEYPVKSDTVITDPVTTFDTLYVGSDPVFDTAFINDTLYITERHKTVMKITKTIEINKTVTKENIARVEQYRLEKESAVKKLGQANEELSELKGKYKIRFWIIIAMGAVIVMLGWGKIQSGWTKVSELFTRLLK